MPRAWPRRPGAQLQKERAPPIVFFDALTPGERDYSTILTKLKQANPQIVFFTGYYNEAGNCYCGRRKRWASTFRSSGGDATNNTDLVKIAGGPAATGFYFVSAPLPQDFANR